MADDWRLEAVCRGMDPAVFFPLPVGVRAERHDDRYAPALAVCARCPVQAECAAAGAEESEGVWGRTVPRDRRAEIITLSVQETCKVGHPMTGENTRWVTETRRDGRMLRRWRCRACQNEANHQYRLRKAAAGA